MCNLDKNYIINYNYKILDKRRNLYKMKTSNKQQATSNKQQATSNKQQATSNKQQATSTIGNY
jgi:hypothetical protein